MSYLLSVIIPTRNRQQYCIAAVKQIISLGLDIEICVQDNSDKNTLQYEFQNLKNVKYHYYDGVLSFVNNFSEAVSLASGEYVCMIGDDDGVLPNIISVTRYLKNNDIDAFIPGLNNIYFWPSSNPICEMYRTGCLIEKKRSNTLTTINPKAELYRLLRHGALNYLDFDLPRLYHGLVKRATLEEIKDKTGYYFGGLTPDIYMAVALSFVTKKVLKVNFPVTIPGICPTSGSSDSATGKHTGELKDAPHFRGHDNYVWESSIPAFYSVETIWAETCVKAIKDFDSSLMCSFRLKPLYNKCLELYPQFSSTIRESAAKNNVSISRNIIKKGNNIKLKIIINKIINRIKNGKPVIYTEVADIEKAVNLVKLNYIKEK